MLASGSVASTAGASDSASGAGAKSLAAGAESSSTITVLGSSPSQVKSVDFLHSTQTGCQPSTTTKLHVLLGKDHHLQARPDYCHGRGAKYAGDVD
jgi:hypothetical protein